MGKYICNISYSALYPRQQPPFKSDNPLFVVDNPLLCVATSWTNQVGYIILTAGRYITLIPRLP